MIAILAASFFITVSCVEMAAGQGADLDPLLAARECESSQVISVTREEAQAYLAVLNSGAMSAEEVLADAGLEFDAIESRAAIPLASAIEPGMRDAELRAEAHAEPLGGGEFEARALDEEFLREFFEEIIDGVMQDLQCGCRWVGGECKCGCVKSRH